MKFSKKKKKKEKKKTEPLELLAKSLARHPGNIYFNQTMASEFCQKDEIWRHEYENTNKIMNLMHKAAPFP